MLNFMLVCFTSVEGRVTGNVLMRKDQPSETSHNGLMKKKKTVDSHLEDETQEGFEVIKEYVMKLNIFNKVDLI